MTRPIQLNKTYGVLHTESFFSFLGFAKKVGSDEIQKIDVYLDDKLIDTIEANEFIQKIDDMYDVESKAFTYNLPTQYIGEKAIISFKNHDSGEELLNSPYILIDKNHEDFNEAKFMHSLSEPISEEMKNMYKPNSIGFLATKENLEDKEFVEYIKELIERFPKVEFKGFCFNKRENILKELNDNFNNLEIIIPNSINDVMKNIEIFIYRQGIDYEIKDILLKYSEKVIPLAFHNRVIFNDITTVKVHYKIQENLELFNFKSKDLEDNLHIHPFLIHNRFLKKINQPLLTIDSNVYNFILFDLIKYILDDNEYKMYLLDIYKKLRNC